MIISMTAAASMTAMDAVTARRPRWDVPERILLKCHRRHVVVVCLKVCCWVVAAVVNWRWDVLLRILFENCTTTILIEYIRLQLYFDFSNTQASSISCFLLYSKYLLFEVEKSDRYIPCRVKNIHIKKC